MTDKKKNKIPDVKVYFVSIIENFMKDKTKYVIYTLLSGIALWGWNSFKNETEKYTPLPTKYAAVLVMHTQDSLFIVNKFKQDSINSINEKKFIEKLYNKIDSIGRVCKFNDSIMALNENEDYQNILIIKEKLRIQ